MARVGDVEITAIHDNVDGAKASTLFDTLLRERHWQTPKAFRAQFIRAARELADAEQDTEFRRMDVSDRQFVRWRHGARPRPYACRILEHLFDTPIEELLQRPDLTPAQDAAAIDVRPGIIDSQPTSLRIAKPPQKTNIIPRASSSFDQDEFVDADVMNKTKARVDDLPFSAMQSFRAADRQVGGGFLYDTVVRYLRTEVAPRVVDAEQGIDGEFAFRAAAAMTEMAGWMAHDAGRDEIAVRHFWRSFNLAKLGRDRQLGVHILGSLSHLANHVGWAPDALRHAQQGQELLKRVPRQPELEARILSVQARGYASLGERRECVRLLDEAERTLQANPESERSAWANPFDAGSLAGEAARCFRLLGDATEAQHRAERVVELRPDRRTRSRAFGQLMLVTLLVARGRPEEACAVAADVVAATEQLGSYLVIQQLRELRSRLDIYKGSGTVADFIVCLDETLRRRAWLNDWSANRGEQVTIGRAEKW